MKTCAFVFARGGSKGLPGKNIRDFYGKPLLAHSLKVAREIPEIDSVFVSTDSNAISNVAKSLGAITIPRPAELAGDYSPEWCAWKHGINWVMSKYGEFERFVSLPATAPLRLAEDVVKCMEALDPQTDIVVTMSPAARSPWFNMVKSDDSGYLSLMIEGNQIDRRQDAPRGYDLTTVAYVSRPGFILSNNSIWDGRVRGVVVPRERALDIDTELDFEVAQFIMQKNYFKYIDG